jgi:hypothetical protein
MDRAIAVGAVGGLALIAAITLAVTPTPQNWGEWYVRLLLVSGGVLVLAAGYPAIRDHLSRPRLVIDDPSTALRGVERRLTSRRSEPMTTTTPTPYVTTTTFSEPIITGSELAITGVYATTHLAPGDQALYGAYVHISNRPRIPGRDAEDVITELRFLASDGSIITQIHGRWSELPQHEDPEPTLEPVAIKVPSNGGRK